MSAVRADAVAALPSYRIRTLVDGTAEWHDETIVMGRDYSAGELLSDVADRLAGIALENTTWVTVPTALTVRIFGEVGGGWLAEGSASVPSTAALLRAKAAEVRAAQATLAALVAERDALIRKMADEGGKQVAIANAAGLSQMAISKQLRRP